jgi:hypothetical protein
MRFSFALIVAAGLAPAFAAAAGQKALQPSRGSFAPRQPYVRISTTDSNLVRLQTAVREFVPDRSQGPCVWLAGVSHVGEPHYYAAMQRFLDARTLVLYEGIGGAAAHTSGQAQQPSSPASADNEEHPPRANDDYGSLQTAMASSLGLVFQLDAIDYSRPNFRNSDLSLEALRDLLANAPADPDNAGAAQGFETLLQAMQGGTFMNTILRLSLGVLGATQKLQALGRLAMIQVLGQIQGDPSQLHGLPPQMKDLLSVLLKKRNDKVFHDLKANLRELGSHDSIAVFFGTGHMPDLERRLRAELHYRPGRQIWLTAFSVDLAKTGITPAEVEFIRNLVRTQLQQLQSPGGQRQPSSK